MTGTIGKSVLFVRLDMRGDRINYSNYSAFVKTRKYPLRGYILGSPGWPESIFSAGLGLTFFSYSHFGKVSTQLLGSRQGSACVDHPTVKIEYT